MEEMLEAWFTTEVSQDEEDQKSLEFLEKYERDN
jgi:hypothetical protein